MLEDRNLVSKITSPFRSKESTDMIKENRSVLDVTAMAKSTVKHPALSSWCVLIFSVLHRVHLFINHTMESCSSIRAALYMSCIFICSHRSYDKWLVIYNRLPASFPRTRFGPFGPQSTFRSWKPDVVFPVASC